MRCSCRQTPSVDRCFCPRRSEMAWHYKDCTNFFCEAKRSGGLTRNLTGATLAERSVLFFNKTGQFHKKESHWTRSGVLYPFRYEGSAEKVRLKYRTGKNHVYREPGHKTNNNRTLTILLVSPRELPIVSLHQPPTILVSVCRVNHTINLCWRQRERLQLLRR
jgi:hypothetical protein